jgi:hypothetical protein
MKTLSNQTIIELYIDSVKMDLDQDFINLLIKEMKTRNIDMSSLQININKRNISSLAEGL